MKAQDSLLSSEQARAVQRPAVDTVVVAGAGTGKTRVLVARFAHLVAECGIPLARLAALTFTDKAAREMRARLGVAFQAAGGDGRALELEQAHIGTLHAFASSLLRRHAIAAHVEPSFAVAEAGEAALALADAVLLAQAGLAADEAGRVAWRTVASRLGVDPGTAVTDLFKRLRGAAMRAADVSWCSTKDDLGALAARFAATRVAALDALALLAAEIKQADDAVRAAGATARDELEAISDVFALEEPADRASALRGFAARLPKPRRVSRDREWARSRKAVDEAACAWAAAELDRVGQDELLPALRLVLSALETAYEGLLADVHALDFDDLERKALALLEHAAAESRRLPGLPQVVLVDEYQDVNPVQQRLLAALRRLGANSFVVGDAKQGIYRFRRADVRVLLAECRRLGAAHVLPISTTYRAAPEVVSCLQELFARLFAEEAAGVPYERLSAGGEFAPAPAQAPPAVRFDLVHLDVTKDSAGRRGEAAHLAADIVSLVASQTPRRKASLAGRPFRYGDIAILLRAKSNVDIYEAALAAAGVPFRTEGGRGWREAREVLDLLDVLRVVHNPEDRFALAAFAMGPALAADEGDLFRWFASAVASPWQAMREDARDRPALRIVVECIERLREEALFGSLSQVVEGALYELELLQVALAAPQGAQRAANLMKALHEARAMESRGRRGLHELLRRLERMREQGIEEAQAPLGGADDDVVRIFTVHGAKGLEFPAVYLADMGRADLVARRRAIAFDAEAGIAARLRDPRSGEAHASAACALLEEADKQAEQQESLRLLYVAATRAEERLTATGSYKGLTKKGDPAGMVGWGRQILDVLGVDLTDGSKVVELDPATGARFEVRIVEGVVPPADVARAAAAPPAMASPPSPAGNAHEMDRSSSNAPSRALAEVAGRPAPLGHTRYVVGVSELLAFAISPREWYRRFVLGLDDEEPRVAGLSSPPSGQATDGESVDLDAPDDATLPATQPARDGDDAFAAEPADSTGRVMGGGLGRHAAAVGTAVHAVLERSRGAADVLDPEWLHEALADVFGRNVPAAALPLARDMLERFVASDVGLQWDRALSAGEAMQREVAFHARIRFADGRRVAGFEGLLVRGSIDLWLPTPRGLLLVDYKTSAPTRTSPTPAHVAQRYAWQLRLYALAAERLTGEDVAGAGLLLLHPGWGPEAVFASVDVGGEALRETRLLVEAFAEAELQGRVPLEWRDLVGDERA